MRERLLSLFSRSRRDQQRELDEEIEAHLQLRSADLEERGMTPQQARAEAIARFGDLSQARRRLYAAGARRDRRLSILEELDDLRRDVTIAWRRMRARKARTAMLLAIFALGIGATTSMFTVVDNVLLRALPFDAPHELVELQSVSEEGWAFPQVSMGNWYDWQAAPSLAASGIYRTFRAAVAAGDEVVRIDATETGGGFFEALQPRVTLGRPLSEQDGESSEAVVVSEGYWRQWLGADESIVGSTLLVDGRARQLVGVLAQGYEFPRGTQLWTVQRVAPRSGAARNNINYGSFARLAPGTTIEGAKAELDSIAAAIRESDPEGLYSHGVGVVPLREGIVGSSATTLRLLMAAVLLVLLIACVNLMGLTLADGRERTDEVTMRLALGAGRRRLIKQLVTEQVLLGLLGGACGLLLAWWGTRFAVSRLWDVLPRADEIVFDLRVALAAVLLSICAGVLSGLLPAWRLASGGSASSLSGTRAIRGGRGLPGAPLVVVEIALTVTLLAGGGLLVRSLTTLIDRDLGFDATRVVTLDVNLTTPAYLSEPTAVTSYWDRLIATLEAVPGVQAVAAGTGIPTGAGGAGFISLPNDPRTEIGARYRVVSDEYFSTLGVRLLEGRPFGPEDTADSQRVVIINRAMAERFWPNEEPLGQSVAARSMESYWYDGAAPWLRVIGVVDDIRQYGFEDTLEPAMFVLYRQIPQQAIAPAAVVRIRPGNLAATAKTLEQAARTVDPTLAVETSYLETRLHDMLSERKLTTTIILSLAVIALLLASLGIYGLLAYAVTVRAPELALRAALGADASQQVSLVVRGALVVVLIGTILGTFGILAANRLLQSLLVDVQLTDPLTYLSVAVVLCVVAAFAVVVPAARAARMDPVDALRGG